MENDKLYNHHYADVGDSQMEVWEIDGHYFWSLKDSKTQTETGAGEATSLDAAKLEAHRAAGVQWKDVVWRSMGV
jgi:hypothetical protein